MKRFIKETLYSLSPLLAVIFLWAVVSLFFSPVIFPSPFETLQVSKNLFTLEFQGHLQLSLMRIFVGATLSFALGTGIAMLSRSLGAHPIVEGCMAIFQVLPGLIIAVIFLLLFGVGSLVPICLIVFMVTPLVIINTSVVLDKKDPAIERVVVFYGGGRWAKMRDIYLPRLVPCMRGNALLATTMAVKVCLLGEFIGSDNGLGYLINISKMYFNMEEVFFYIAIILVLIFAFQLSLRLLFQLFLKKFFY